MKFGELDISQFFLFKGQDGLYRGFRKVDDDSAVPINRVGLVSGEPVHFEWTDDVAVYA